MNKNLIAKALQAVAAEMIDNYQEVEEVIKSLPPKDLIGIFRIGECAAILLDKRIAEVNSSEPILKENQ
jgi:hypothetical protein